MNHPRLMQKRIFNILLALALLAGFVTPALAGSSAPPIPGSLHSPVIFFASDGLRQDLVESTPPEE